MRGFAFPRHQHHDWRAPFYIGANDEFVTWNPPDDFVTLGMSQTW